MKKNHPSGSQPADAVQPEDPIKEFQTACDVETSAEASQAQTDTDNDKSADASEKSSELTAIQDQLEAREKELTEISDKYLRMAAEYDNFRRRSQKEKESLYLDSVSQVVKEWLPVLDNLDRAVQALDQSRSDQDAGIGEGIEMVRKQAYEIMEKLGVTEIECLNQTFDPTLHDAVMHVEDESVGACTVIEVLQKGYQRGDRVIRHSIVKVAN